LRAAAAAVLTCLSQQVHVGALQVQLQLLGALLCNGQLITCLVQANHDALAPLLSLQAAWQQSNSVCSWGNIMCDHLPSMELKEPQIVGQNITLLLSADASC
jgi:hypothetical protein